MNNFIQKHFLVLLAVLVTLTARAQTTVQGKLIYDSNQPVPGTKIFADLAADTTDSRGQFVLRLPAGVKAGEDTVTIHVNKSDYLIDKPLDGKWNPLVAEFAGRQVLTVIIVRKGSLTLLSDARLNQMMDQFKDNFTRQISSLRQQSATSRKELSASKQEIAALKAQVLPDLLGQWQQEYGLSSEQIKLVLDKHANTKNPADDFRAQALKEYYNGNFSAASNFFEKAALAKEDDITRKEAELELDKLSAFNNWKAKGESDSSSYDFSASLKSYDRAAKFLAKEKHPQEWAELEVLFGISKQEAGSRAGDATAQLLLKDAIKHHQNALTFYTQKDWLVEWVISQCYLGAAKSLLAQRTQGERRGNLIEEAEAGLQGAVGGNTKLLFPLIWSDAQHYLGSLLMLKSEGRYDESSKQYLSQAEMAFRKSLEFRDRNRSPIKWAATKNNMGIALKELGARMDTDSSTQLLTRAITEFREALVVRTQELLPYEWATTQNNLGNALSEMARQSKGSFGIEFLAEATSAYKKALLVRTRENLPKDWADTQDNLGQVLLQQGQLTSGELQMNFFLESISASSLALKVYTLEAFPYDWAIAQNSLGLALEHLSSLVVGDRGLELLASAVSAYRSALLVYTKKDMPQLWATTQNNLGYALLRQGQRTGDEQDTKLVQQAIEAFKLALAVRQKEYDARGWAQTQENLADAYYLLKDWENALDCYANVFGENQGLEDVNTRLSGILHERIFKFAEAFELNGHRVKLNAEDLSAQSDFAETHFTTTRFSEADTRINALLANPKVETSTKTALRAIQIANGLALGKSATVNLNSLIALIAAQPPEFQVGWSFRGTLHFIETNDKFTANRAWLQQLFAAFAQENRDAILKALRALPEIK